MRFATVTFYLVLTAYGISARANYDSNCIEALHAGIPNSILRTRFSRWEKVLAERFQPIRALTPVENEALMDFTHGLNIVAQFRNGVRVLAMVEHGPEKTATLRDLLRQSSLEGVMYLPGSRGILGDIYAYACEVLARADCAPSYEMYSGLGSGVKRPFTPSEELILKWATLHMIPLGDVLLALRQQNKSERDVLSELTILEASRNGEAHRLLAAQFKPDEALQLSRHVVTPYLRHAFDRIAQLYREPSGD